MFALKVLVLPAARFSVPPLIVAWRLQFRPPLSVNVPVDAIVPPVRLTGPLKVAPAVLIEAPLKFVLPLIVAPLAKLCAPALNCTPLPTMLNTPAWAPCVCRLIVPALPPTPESTVPPFRLLKRTWLAKPLLPTPPVLARVPLLLKLPPLPEVSLITPSDAKLNRPVLLKVVLSLISSARPSLR